LAISLKAIQGFDLQNHLGRIMRPQNVAMLGFAIRVACFAICVAALLSMAYFSGWSYITAKSSALEVQNKIRAMLESINNQPPVEQSDAKAVVLNSQIFGQIGGSKAPPPQATAAPQSPLALSLIGTFVTGGSEPYAIIEDKKKAVQDVFVLEQNVFNQATLKKIYEDRVEVMRDGRLETLKIDDLPSAGGGAGTTPGAISDDAEIVELTIDENEITTALDNIPLILTQARAVPYFKEGRSIGLRMYGIKTGSIYEKLGLRNGDILKSVNENSLGDLSQALKLLEQLKSERSVALVLERDKKDREFRYTRR